MRLFKKKNNQEDVDRCIAEIEKSLKKYDCLLLPITQIIGQEVFSTVKVIKKQEAKENEQL